jgi:hypothetical protein
LSETSKRSISSSKIASNAKDVFAHTETIPIFRNLTEEKVTTPAFKFTTKALSRFGCD